MEISQISPMCIELGTKRTDTLLSLDHTLTFHGAQGMILPITHPFKRGRVFSQIKRTACIGQLNGSLSSPSLINTARFTLLTFHDLTSCLILCSLNTFNL